VYVATGSNHPALYATSAAIGSPQWLSREHEQRLQAEGTLRCQYKVRYGQAPKPCTVHLLPSGEGWGAFEASPHCRLHPHDSEFGPGSLLVNFQEPALAVTPQQAFVMYDGDVCLGSAPVIVPGR
jgi:tRNA U34 2-thiouridine synthase MnmA/TrmU